MIRFIVQRHEQDHNSGLERRDLVTVDASVPELERLLRQGGSGEMGFENWQLLGAELLEKHETVQIPRAVLEDMAQDAEDSGAQLLANRLRSLRALLAGGAE